jgi:hypothetical protein
MTWLPLAHSRPKPDEYVLLYFPRGYWLSESDVAVGFWSAQYQDWYDQEGASHSMTAFGSKPTHWQPRPEPPR